MLSFCNAIANKKLGVYVDSLLREKSFATARYSEADLILVDALPEIAAPDGARYILVTGSISRTLDEIAHPAPAESDELVGCSAAMKRVREYVARVAASTTSVLITGETGTGKELVAAQIHRLSPRRKGPLVAVNCAAIPDALIESELFGYERGAFTGAVAVHDGHLRQAHRGTIFFDEVGDMSPLAQAKILRALERRRIQRLGGNGEIEIDVRIVAATNRDVETLAADNSFRKDLFYRLCVARIHLAPLRDRLEDLPFLAAHFIREMNVQFDRSVTGVSDRMLRWMRSYAWPGNVRELRNVLEAAFIDLPPGKADLLNLCHGGVSQGGSEAEQDRLLRVLNETNWNKSRTARALKWSRMTLYRKMTKYHIGSSARVTVAS